MTQKTIKSRHCRRHGYTGVELLRLLAQHPHCELRVITSRKEAGTGVAEMFPNLRGGSGSKFTEPSAAALNGCDVVVLRHANGVAMNEARALYELACAWSTSPPISGSGMLRSGKSGME